MNVQLKSEGIEADLMTLGFLISEMVELSNRTEAACFEVLETDGAGIKVSDLEALCSVLAESTVTVSALRNAVQNVLSSWIQRKEQ